MAETEFNQTRKDWQLNAAELGRVLCVHTNKKSEYLAGVTRILCAGAMHIETLQFLPDETRLTLFQQRLNRNVHS